MKNTANCYAWINQELYPFQSNYIDLDGGQMHYLDEGEGDVILFVHGTPTWSFLYRDFIKKFSKDYRCIAIDHLGFGLSEFSDSFDGRVESHAKNLSEFIQKMKLQDITLVVHDFGGPIGLGAGIENSDKIKRVVLLNTWLWATNENKSAKKIDSFINSWLGRFLYLNLNISPKVLLKKGFYDSKQLSKEVHQHYIKPFPNKQSRLPLLNMAKSLVGSSDWYQEKWNELGTLNDKDWLIIWGVEDDFITKEYLEKWTQRINNAQVEELNTGHFVQEEKTEESMQLIADFIAKTTPA